MNIRQAECVLAIFELGSVTAAANKLFVSQPALSRTLQTIESDLGAKIFDRTISPIKLTYAGERYIKSARKILAINNNLVQEIKEINEGTSGKIRIAISSMRGAAMLPKIIPIFSEKYPNIEIELVETGSAHTEELLLLDKADVSFGVDPNVYNSHIFHKKLFVERMLLLAGKDTEIAKEIPNGIEISITEAKNEKFISLEMGHGVRAYQDRMFSEHFIAPKIIFITKSLYTACNMVEALGGVTIIPETLAAEVSKNSTNFSYLISGKEYERGFYLCYNSEMSRPKYIDYFINLCSEIF